MVVDQGKFVRPKLITIQKKSFLEENAYQLGLIKNFVLELEV